MEEKATLERPKLAIFLSGQGTNFEAIAKACQDKRLDAEISVVFSDQVLAPGIEKAKLREIDVETLTYKPPRKDFDKAVLALLSRYTIDWVVLCGYMRILTAHLLKAFPKRVINIHPSLLPKYPGLHAIKQAYDAGEKETGVTVHFVDEGIDTGAVIMQKKIAILPQESFESLKQRVHTLEHQLYTQALTSVFKKASQHNHSPESYV